MRTTTTESNNSNGKGEDEKMITVHSVYDANSIGECWVVTVAMVVVLKVQGNHLSDSSGGIAKSGALKIVILKIYIMIIIPSWNFNLGLKFQNNFISVIECVWIGCLLQVLHLAFEQWTHCTVHINEDKCILNEDKCTVTVRFACHVMKWYFKIIFVAICLVMSCSYWDPCFKIILL